MIITNRIGVKVLDYKNNKWIFKQTNNGAEFSEPWISGDGKEIRFIFQKKGKPATKLLVEFHDKVCFRPEVFQFPPVNIMKQFMFYTIISK